MKLFGLPAIRKVSLFRRRKTPEINHFFVVCNLGRPRLFLKPFFVVNAFISVFIRRFAVGSIFAMARKAKVRNAIVGSITIDMVNLFFRPFFVYEKPSKPVPRITSAINFYVAISFIFFHIPSFIAHLNFRARRRPYENPGFRVIMKDLEKFFMFDHGGILPEREADYNRKIA